MIRENLLYFYVQIKIIVLFFFLWISDAVFIIRNLPQDSKKYNLKYLIILLNAVVKYPLLGFRPSEFFMYKLYKNNYREYLPFFIGVNKIIKKNKQKSKLINNKLEFKIHIGEKINNPALIASYDHKRKKITYYMKPQSDKLVLKPLKGMWGAGIRIINSEELDLELKNYNQSCIIEDYIQQHHVLKNIFPDSVNTLRILTCKTNNYFIVIHAILKLGRTNTNHTDNIAQGGISTTINMDTGVLGIGSTFYEFGHNDFMMHPNTNIKFYGITVPYFKEALDIAIKAHQLFPMFTLIGWDIAITEKGPTVVEGNKIPDLSLHQIYHPLKKQLLKYLL